MARILALRATLERLTAVFVDGVFEALGQAIVTSAATTSAPAKATSRRGTTPAAAVRGNARARARVTTFEPPRGKTHVTTHALERAIEPPNAVTDPELLLAALARGDDAPEGAEGAEGAVHDRGHASARAVRARRPSSATLDGPAREAPPAASPVEVGPALRSDEVSLRTPRGGVVIRRIRRETQSL